MLKTKKDAMIWRLWPEREIDYRDSEIKTLRDLAGRQQGLHKLMENVMREHGGEQNGNLHE